MVNEKLAFSGVKTIGSRHSTDNETEKDHPQGALTNLMTRSSAAASSVAKIRDRLKRPALGSVDRGSSSNSASAAPPHLAGQIFAAIRTASSKLSSAQLCQMPISGFSSTSVSRCRDRCSWHRYSSTCWASGCRSPCCRSTTGSCLTNQQTRCCFWRSVSSAYSRWKHF